MDHTVVQLINCAAWLRSCYRLFLTGSSSQSAGGWVEDPSLPSEWWADGSETVLQGNTAVGGAGAPRVLEQTLYLCVVE